LRVSSRADLATWFDREAATTYRRPSRGCAAELDYLTLIEQARPNLGEEKARLMWFQAGLGIAG